MDPISEEPPKEITFRTAYRNLGSGAFVKGHKLVLRWRGATHVMVISHIVRKGNEDSVEITAVYSHTMPPLPEFNG